MKDYLKRTLIIGGGQLGMALFYALDKAEMMDYPEIDISREDDLREKIDFSRYSVILNAAAATQVDNLEKPEMLGFATGVNANGPKNLAKIARDFGIPIVHVSSDYVFDGSRKNHSEDEKFSALNVYGKTKAEGDENVVKSGAKYYILRSSWVIGKPQKNAAGKATNIVKTAYECAKNDVKPSVVNDQFGRQTYVSELTRAIEFLLKNDAPEGVYNLTNDGKVASLAEIWKYIFAKTGRDPEDVKEVSTDEFYAGKGFAKTAENYQRKNNDGSVDYIALRPVHSDLNLAKIQKLGFQSEDYFAKIDEYLDELKKEDEK